jgi:hypothetical protein
MIIIIINILNKKQMIAYIVEAVLRSVMEHSGDDGSEVLKDLQE